MRALGHPFEKTAKLIYEMLSVTRLSILQRLDILETSDALTVANIAAFLRRSRLIVHCNFLSEIEK